MTWDPFDVVDGDPILDRMDDHDLKVIREEANTERRGQVKGFSAFAEDPEFEAKRLEGLQRHQRTLVAERKKRQARLLQLLSSGYTRKEAVWDPQVNVTENTIYRWMGEDPRFKAAVKRAEREGRALTEGVNASNARTLPFHILRKMCFGRDTFPFQQVIIDIIENAPEGEITMILLPPGTGKTMTIEDWLTIQLAINPAFRVMYISETKDLGERTLSVIKSRFENEDGDFDKLRDLFGERYREDSDQVWRSHEIRLLGADHELRDFNMRARGMNTNIYSIRSDITILDDIQSDRTLSQTMAYLSKLQGTIFTRREGGVRGKIVYIGTHLGPGDLPSELHKQKIVLPEHTFILPLIGKNGKSNFEEIIHTEDLPQLIRQMGDRFQAVYQQNPSGGKGKIFTGIVDNMKDERYTVNTWYEAHEVATPDGKPQEILSRVVSIDPALDGGNAITAAGFSATDLWIYDHDLRFETNRISYSVDKIEEFVLAYQADTVIIEDKAYQKGLLTLERMEAMAQAYGFDLVPHTTSSEKFDPVWGVAKMEVPISFGRIHVPWGDEYSQERCCHIPDQLEVWDPNIPTRALVQDSVMSLWFIQVRAMRERRRLAAMRRAQENAQRATRTHERTRARFKTSMGVSSGRRRRH